MEAAMISRPQTFAATKSEPPPASRTEPPSARPLASAGQGRHRRTPLPVFQCEAVAYTPQAGRCFPLGSYPAATPRLALRWLCHRARDIADQLDPPAAQPVRHWISDHAEHERAMAALVEGQPYTFTAFEDSTRYTLSAQPTGSAR
jgi:hypothetical protein